MFSFSQEMRSDQAALIPPASGGGGGRGLSGAGSVSPRPGRGRVVLKLREGGHFGAAATQSFTSSDFSQFSVDSGIRSVPGHPLDRPTLSLISERCTWSPLHAGPGGTGSGMGAGLGR